MNDRSKNKLKKFLTKKNINKVLLIAGSDWANLGYLVSQALQEIGVDAIMLIKKESRNLYPNHGIIFRNINNIKNYSENADVIIFMHSQYVETGVNLKNKRILVWHSGSRFRQHSAEVNKIFNPIVDVSICGRDVFGLGAKNEKWVGGLADTKFLKPVYNRSSDKLIIAHYPSSAKGKGIDIIEKSINDLKKEGFDDKFVFKYSSKNVSWNEQIKRVSDCDIYIENMAATKKSKKLSVFGLTALETAALGKIVVTRFLFPIEYERNFGKCNLQIANNQKELTQKLKSLILLSNDEILKLKQQSRDWVERCHSFEAVAVRLVRLFG